MIPIQTSDIVMVEPTYNMTQILAINQAWMDRLLTIGAWMLIIGFIIGAIALGFVAPYVREHYGRSE